MRPVIGISTYREQARWGVWDVPAVLLPAAYPDAVADAGGEPVLIPTGAGSGAVLSVLAGLVLAGGADVEPAAYGARPGPRTTITRPDRDARELDLLRAADDLGVPVLGVCRGMQLLNVARGGTLHQHLPDVVSGEHDRGAGDYARHTVRTAPGSAIAGVLGPAAAAHCHHHQGIDRLGAGLVATAWAQDGTVEAVEAHPANDPRAWRLGVQWHPEVGEERALFAALVARAAAGAAP